MITNTIEVSDEDTHVLFGHQNISYEKVERVVKSGEISLPEAIYKHEINEGLKSNAMKDMLNSSVNTFGCVELDMLEIEETRIKFNRKFCESVSLVAYCLATDKIIGKSLYGTSVWLKEI